MLILEKEDFSLAEAKRRITYPIFVCSNGFIVSITDILFLLS